MNEPLRRRITALRVRLVVSENSFDPALKVVVWPAVVDRDAQEAKRAQADGDEELVDTCPVEVVESEEPLEATLCV